MSLYFEYSDGCKKLKSFNQRAIEKISYVILKRFPELENNSSLLYFFHRPNLPQNWLYGTASFFIIGSPFSSMEIYFPHLAHVINKHSNLDFAFHFTRLITEGDDITKVIYVAHEFQHAVQYKRDKKMYFHGRIIHHFLADKHIEEEKTPLEYDALRKSKIVAAFLFGNNKVEEFIERMLLNPDMKKFIWAVFNSIDIQSE